MTYECSAYLDGGHDIERLAITFYADTRAKAESMFHKAMKQLGFKRSDYGHVTVSKY